MRFWKPRAITNPPSVMMLVASYLDGEHDRRWDTLQCLLYSLKAQTYQNWQVVVVHDGPIAHDHASLKLMDRVSEIDPRITLVETDERLKSFGHKHRHEYAKASSADILGFTNDDNYYAPVYFEWMIHEMLAKKAELAYCDMVHSHKLWKPFTTAPRYKHLDMGGFLAKRSLVERTPWTDYSFSGDGMFINALTANSRKTVKVASTLFVHN